MRIAATTAVMATTLTLSACTPPQPGTCPVPDTAPLSGTPTALQQRFATGAFWDHLIAHGSNRQLAAMIAYSDDPGFDARPADITRAKAALAYRGAQGCADIPDSPRI